MKRVYKRIFSVVLALTVAVGSVCWRPPKAKAVVIDATAAFGAAAAAAAVNGTTATTLFTGMGTSAATSSVIGLMDSYAVATGVAASGTALASTIATGILVAGGTLLVGAAAAALIGGFIDWMREQEGLKAGGSDVVLSEDAKVFLDDGTSVDFVAWSAENGRPFNGTIFQDGIHYSLQNGTEFYSTQSSFFFKFPGDAAFSSGAFSYLSGANYGFYLNGSTVIVKRITDGITSQGSYGWTANWRLDPVDVSFSLQPKLEFQNVPEIPEGQVLSIDTGLTGLPSEDPQAIADAIMQSAIDGALDPNVSVVTDPTVTPEPDPGTDPEPGGAETTSWLSRILESIKSLPQRIAEAISSIFVPSPDFFPTAISNLKDTYSDRMGLLTYPFSILFDFLDRILNLNDQPPILRWDNIYLPSHPGTPIIAAGSYNLNDTLSTTAGRRVHDVYLVIVDAMMIVAFLDLCRRKYQKIIHN